MSLPEGLQKRGSMFWVRVRIPDDLCVAYGKRELHRSLRTSNLREAKARLHLERAKLDAELASLKARIDAAQPAGVLAPISEREAWALAVQWLIAAEKNATPGEVTEERLKDFAYLQDFGDTNTRSYVHACCTNLLQKEGRSAPIGSAGYVQLQNSLHAAMVEAERRALVRLGSSLSSPVDPQFKDVSQNTRLHPGATISLKELLKRYRADAKTVYRSPKTQLKQQAQDRLILQLLGAERMIETITREDIREVRDVISRLPRNWTKKFPNVPARQVPVDDASKLSPTTANSYLSLLTAVMQYAFDEGMLERNLGGSIRVPQAPSAEKPRLPFTPDELNKIFRMPLYVGCLDDEYGFNKPGPNRPRRGRFWVPLIALYTGMRMQEICQLTADDFTVLQGVDIIHVQIGDNTKDEEERKRVKTAAGLRFVPVHSELKKFGLLSHVEVARSNGETARIFPELRRASSGYLSDLFSKRYAYFLDKAGIVERTKTFHSYRHSYRDALREADIGLSRAQALGGWSSRGVADHYGVGLSARSLAEAIQKVRYHDVDLSHLYADA